MRIREVHVGVVASDQVRCDVVESTFSFSSLRFLDSSSPMYRRDTVWM